MIEYPFNAKAAVKMRAAQLRDLRSLTPLDEYRLTMYEEVAPNAGLPDSIRLVLDRAQMIALRRVIDGVLERSVQ